MYPHLMDPYTEITKTIVGKAMQQKGVEKLFLIGAALTSVRGENIFSSGADVVHYPAHYYVLLITTGLTREEEMRLQDAMENGCKPVVPLTALAFGLPTFHQWLAEGHPFAAQVYEKAVLLYESDVKLLPPPAPVNEEAWKEKTASLYTQGINKTTEFLVGADLYRLRKQNSMAVFMLHQALEQLLSTYFQVGTGLRVSTHSLDKLLRYGSLLSYKVSSVFPRNNDREEKLFSLLHQAYIHSRYKEGYSVCCKDLLELTERIHQVKAVVELKVKEGSCGLSKIHRE